MNQLPELIWGLGIAAVAIIGGVQGNERLNRPAPLEVCMVGQTVTIWSDEWQECFKRIDEAATCGKCGLKSTPICPKIKQMPHCVAVEGRLP
jgi:hypothetical protein